MCPSPASRPAIGYAEASGIPYSAGLVKNAYVGRTFIQPSQSIRQLGIRLKLNPLREVVRGKRVVMVDDSIVRGNTQRAQVRLLREAGAIEIHVRISSPPVKWPCFYGIDFATRAELIANGLDVEGIRRSIGADSLGYVSLDGLIAATEQPKTRLCRACFDGEYPIPLPADDLIGKHVLEGVQRRVAPLRPDSAARQDSDASGYHRGAPAPVVHMHRPGRTPGVPPQQGEYRDARDRTARELRAGTGTGTASGADAEYRRTVTYADAGVSIHAGEEAVELLKTKVHRTWRPGGRR